MKALRKLKDDQIVRKALLLENLHYTVKGSFIDKYNDKVFLADVLTKIWPETTYSLNNAITEAIKKIDDPVLLDKIIRSKTVKSVKRGAINQLKNQNTLYRLMVDGFHEFYWFILDDLNDKTLLEKVSQLDLSPEILISTYKKLGDEELAFNYYLKQSKVDEELTFGYMIHLISDKEKLEYIINNSKVPYDRVRAIESYYGLPVLAVMMPKLL